MTFMLKLYNFTFIVYNNSEIELSCSINVNMDKQQCSDRTAFLSQKIYEVIVNGYKKS